MDRTIRLIQAGVGVDQHRLAGEDGRVWQRHTQSRYLTVEVQLPGIAGDIGGHAARSRSTGGKLFDLQASGGIGRGERPSHMGVERHRLPGNIRPRPHGRRLADTIEFDRVVVEIDRAAHCGMQRTRRE